jgi:hypothetical protein
VRSKAQEYQRKAVNCLTSAGQATDPAAKASLLIMAQSWQALADQAERNSKADLVYETPPSRPEQRQPIVKQQQQVQPTIRNDLNKSPNKRPR